MRFKLSTFVILFFNIVMYAQMGINTDNATASLKIDGKPDQINVMDGLIPPIVTKDQLNKKNYSSTIVPNTYNPSHKGIFVYVNNISTPTNEIKSAVTDVNDIGLYEFDGTKWNYFLLSSTDFTVYQSSDFQHLNTSSILDQTITFTSSNKLIEMVTTFIPSESSFQINSSGYYELSGFIGFNGNVEISPLDNNRLLAVIFKIQRKPNGSNIWSDIEKKELLMVYDETRIGTTISILPFKYYLNTNDKIRLVIQRPEKYGSYTNEVFREWTGNGHINKPNGQTYTKSIVIKKI